MMHAVSVFCQREIIRALRGGSLCRSAIRHFRLERILQGVVLQSIGWGHLAGHSLQKWLVWSVLTQRRHWISQNLLVLSQRASRKVITEPQLHSTFAFLIHDLKWILHWYNIGFLEFMVSTCLLNHRRTSSYFLKTYLPTLSPLIRFGDYFQITDWNILVFAFQVKSILLIFFHMKNCFVVKQK